MPDPVILSVAMMLAAGLAGAVMLLGWTWRASRPWHVAAVSALALMAGWAMGLAWVQLLPRWFAVGADLSSRSGEGAGFATWIEAWWHWPPQARDRLLLVLVPLTVLVEVIAGLLPWRWPSWGLRAVLAGVMLPILLAGSIYLGDGPGAWSGTEQMMWLGLGPVLMLALWAGLIWLDTRPPRLTTLPTLGILAGLAGMAVMMSGSLGTGQTGLMLAGGVAGVYAALWRVPAKLVPGVGVGIALTGCLGVIWTGHFFAELSLTESLLLTLAPLAAALVELPAIVRRTRPWHRGVARMVLPLIPGLIALMLAYLRMRAEMAADAALGY